MHKLGLAVGARYRALAESLARYSARVGQVLHQTRLRLQGLRSHPRPAGQPVRSGCAAHVRRGIGRGPLPDAPAANA